MDATPHTLVVSNPPHQEPNAERAAALLGLSPADVRLKANYRVPEIWLASPDRDVVEQAARELRETGLSLVVVSAAQLVAVPRATSVQSFAFTEQGLVARGDRSEVELSYDLPVVAVYCTPQGLREQESQRSNPLAEGLRQRSSSSSVFMTRDSLVGFGGRSSMALGGGAEPAGAATPAFCDLYATPAGTLLRLAVIQAVADFSGLGEQALSSRAANLAMFVAEIESRFKRAQVDRRLLNVVARSRAVVGKPSHYDHERKGFSYATEALSRLLGSISPDLKGISQFELSSRLAYLTSR